MWIGLCWSRALLSVALILFLVIGLRWYGREAWAEVRRTPWLMGMILLFLLPFLTIFWSADVRGWWKVVQDKLPLAFFPFTIALLRSVLPGWRDRLLMILSAIVLTSCLYSIWHFLWLPDISAAYLRGQVMPVSMGKDHVRFSWLVALVFAWLLYALLHGQLSSWMRRVGMVLVIFFGLFLHLLAVRTGLLGCYLAMICIVGGRLKARMRIYLGLIMLLLPLLAWFLMPTFQHRFRFVVWDFQHYTRGGYVEGLNDAPRVLSLQAGMKVVANQPWLGAGAGDLRAEMSAWYSKHAPYMQVYEHLLPSNQWLVYAGMAGIPAAMIAGIIFLLPFFARQFRSNTLWLTFQLLALAGFCYEIALETQYGVFIFGFFSCFMSVLADLPGPDKHIGHQHPSHQ